MSEDNCVKSREYLIETIDRLTEANYKLDKVTGFLQEIISFRDSTIRDLERALAHERKEHDQLEERINDICERMNSEAMEFKEGNPFREALRSFEDKLYDALLND